MKIFPPILFFLMLANGVFAQTPTYVGPDGLRLTCLAPHFATGEMVPVRGINGNANGFWGFATYDQSGWPTIIFDINQLRNLPRIMIRFTYYHECAHLTIPTQDEFEANCEGLINMRRNRHITPRGERTIARVMNSLPVLPPQYGGSGPSYWRATLRCANG